MPEVIPSISRHKISKEYQYPLQYSDVAPILLRLSKSNVYLRLVFWDHHARDMEYRAKAKNEGRYSLLGMGWNREELIWSYMNGSHSPWANADNPIVVSGFVDAVPKLLLLEHNVNRPLINRILGEQLKKLLPHDLAERRWQIQLDLLTQVPAIEYRGQVFTGLRREPEIKVLYPLGDER